MRRRLRRAVDEVREEAIDLGRERLTVERVVDQARFAFLGRPAFRSERFPRPASGERAGWLAPPLRLIARRLLLTLSLRAGRRDAAHLNGARRQPQRALGKRGWRS